MLHARRRLQGAREIFLLILIDADAVQKSGKMAAQDRHRRFQLMGSSCKKRPTLQIQRPFLLHLAAQRCVGRLQRLQRLRKLRCHLIETSPQMPDLVLSGLLTFPVEIHIRHFSSDVAHLNDRPRDVSGIYKRPQKRKQQQCQQHPRRHLDQRAHRYVFCFQPRRHIERVGARLIRKKHLGCQCRLLRCRHSDGRFCFVCRCGGLCERFTCKLLVGEHDPAIRRCQCHICASLAHKILQRRAAICQRNVLQRLSQRLDLSCEISADHCTIAARRCPGDQAEGDRASAQQNEDSDEKNAGCQAFTDFLSQHDSQLPSLFQCN